MKKNLIGFYLLAVLLLSAPLYSLQESTNCPGCGKPGSGTSTYGWNNGSGTGNSAMHTYYRVYSCSNADCTTDTFNVIVHQHQQNYNGPWFSNESEHYKQCTGSNCKPYTHYHAAHTYGGWSEWQQSSTQHTHSRSCTTCGYTQTVSADHNWQGVNNTLQKRCTTCSLIVDDAGKIQAQTNYQNTAPKIPPASSPSPPPASSSIPRHQDAASPPAHTPEPPAHASPTPSTHPQAAPTHPHSADHAASPS